MKKIQIILFTIAVAAMLPASCDSTTYQDISAVVTNPTYVANIAPVVNAKCTSCHSNGSQSPDLQTYDQVKDAVANGDVICRIDTQSCGSVMPESGRLPQATIDMIKLWATNDYPNQ